ncbi:glutamine amidotransferase-related protein, partial [Lysinibacillus sp. D4A3_S15]|uniref:glutamine amidotransferase-related protein n=1 Tax=Lysinibacillus sp. D4A3_S15 TaxID=2941227 RepID=UPI00201C869E
IQVMRFHSLVIEEPSLHSDFNIIATASDDEEILAIQHKKYPLYGLQFHPESIGTKEGSRMMQAFFERIA